MNKSHLSLIAATALLSIACGDDGETTVALTPEAGVEESTATTSSADTTSTNDESTTKREGPWGCYLEDHHKCDCSIESEAACDGVGLWVEGCSTCDSTAGDTSRTPSDGGSPSDASVPDAATPDFGCYDPAAHACTCGEPESACEEGNIWTSDCECAVGSDAAIGTSAEPADASASDSGTNATSVATSTDGGVSSAASSAEADAGAGWGCYDPMSHGCDCVVSAEQCDADDGIWTIECACVALDAGQ